MATDVPGNGGAMSWRLTNIERRVDRLYDLEPAVVAREVSNLHDDLMDVRAEFKGFREELAGVRKALWGFGLSVAGGAVIFAVTAFQVWG